MLGLGNTLVNNKFGNIFTGILNKISVPSAAAYSLRKLDNNYTGSAIRVRRSSDNAETDIGFTAGGNLDETALLDHTAYDIGRVWDGGVLVASDAGLQGITQLSNGDVLTVGFTTNRVYRSTDNGATWDGGVLISGAGLVGITQLSNGDVLTVGSATNRVYRSSGTGYVTTWYDQSGNGRNATQTTAGSQPSIVKFGVLNEDVNGNVFLDFDTKFMTGAVGLGTAQSIVAVYSKSVNGVNTHIFGSGKDGADTGINIFEDTANKTNVTRDASIFSDPVDSSLTKKIIVGENTNDPPQYYKNGVQNILTSVLPTSVEANLISIGTSGFPMQAKFYGGMIFTNTLSTSDRQTLERNQGNFYGITVA